LIMKAAKFHGLGNDFLIVRAEDAAETGQSLDRLAQLLCRRHRGIGADGVLFFQPTVRDAEADVSALIFNADGSHAEISGNGMRCLAAFLLHEGELDSSFIRIRSVTGVRGFLLKEQTEHTYVFENSLGVPVTDPSGIPVLVGGGLEKIIDFPLHVGSHVIPVTVTSMGNPHCSTFWPDLDGVALETLGPLLENHRSFPKRTNVEFVQVLDAHCLRVRFWERGVGRTLASGTGSAAAVVAAVLQGLVESPVRVEVELGALEVAWEAPGELVITGPAEYVCSCNVSCLVLP
jgi:diaminopimelate epimerase